MTPDGLRALADEATPGPWVIDTYTYSPETEEDARLIALAPDLARLCAEMAQIVEKTIYQVPGYTGPDVWWAEESREALTKLSELEAK